MEIKNNLLQQINIKLLLKKIWDIASKESELIHFTKRLKNQKKVLTPSKNNDMKFFIYECFMKKIWAIIPHRGPIERFEFDKKLEKETYNFRDFQEKFIEILQKKLNKTLEKLSENQVENLIREIHLNLIELDKTTFKLKIKAISDIKEISFSQIFNNKIISIRPHSCNITRIQKKKPEENYESAYKGFRFLSDKMKTNMRNFKEEIFKNNHFSSSKQNCFSLCYPPATKLRKLGQTNLNVISMICLEDYEDCQVRKPTIYNIKRKIERK